MNQVKPWDLKNASDKQAYQQLLQEKQKILNSSYNNFGTYNKQFNYNYININKYDIKFNSLIEFIDEYNKFIYSKNTKNEIIVLCK